MKLPAKSPSLKEAFHYLAGRAQPVLLFFAIFGAVILYLKLLGASTFWDDHRIFENEVITRDPSPLRFWTRGHPETKAWPLFFTFLWGFYHWFGPVLWAYHSLNLAVHLLNGMLVYQIARTLKLKWAAFPAAVFLLHPVMVETVGWIFQLTKLFSAFFLLLWYYFRLLEQEKKIRPFLRMVPLSAAMLVGGYAYLITAWECVLLFRQTASGFSRNRLLAALGVGALLYVTFLASSGVNVLRLSDQPTRAYHNHFGSVTGCEYKPSATPLSIADRSVQASARYAFDIVGIGPTSIADALCLWVMKVAAVGVSSENYARRFFLPFPQRIPNLTVPPDALVFLCYFLLGLSVLGGAFWVLRARSELVPVALTYLPVSGLFYFAWLDLSLTADRLIYVAFAFFILGLWRLAEPWVSLAKKGKIVAAAWLVFLMVQSHLRTNYMQALYSLPFRCIICVVEP